MEMPKHADADKARFRELAAPLGEVKPMFGSVGAFVEGAMFAGLFGTRFGVKLDEAAADELRAVPGTGPFGPAERPMKGWVSLPEDVDDEDAVSWFARARAHVASPPPKPKRR